MSLVLRPLAVGEEEKAQRMFQQAFGVEFGLPGPMAFMGDAALVTTRCKYLRTIAAELEGQLVGFNMITVWGTFAFFGPLVVDVQCQGKKVAQRLLEATMELLEQQQGVTLVGLYTLPTSPKHLHLYGKFGFEPQYLTYIWQKDVAHDEVTSPPKVRRFSAEFASCGEEFLATAAGITSRHVLPGLDVRSDIQAVQAHRLGDTLLVDGAFAVVHVGPGTEAESDTCFVKFAAAQGVEAFSILLAAVEAFTRECGKSRVIAGVNTARVECLRCLQQHPGYRLALTGVAMQRTLPPNSGASPLGYNRAGVFVLDDWR